MIYTPEDYTKERLAETIRANCVQFVNRTTKAGLSVEQMETHACETLFEAKRLAGNPRVRSNVFPETLEEYLKRKKWMNVFMSISI